MNKQNEAENKLDTIKKEKRNLVRDFILILLSPFIFLIIVLLLSFSYSEYLTYKYRNVIDKSVCEGDFFEYGVDVNYMKILASNDDTYTVACNYTLYSNHSNKLKVQKVCTQLEFELLPDGTINHIWPQIIINNPLGNGGESFTWPPYCF
jgi:hypothetical protein